MDEGRLVTRYAKALLLSATEAEIAEKVGEDLQVLDGFMKKEPALKLLLFDPVIKSSSKQEAVALAFKNLFQPLTVQFMQLIIKNKREQYLPWVPRMYLDLYRKAQGIKPVVLTTVKHVSKEVTELLVTELSRHYKSKIEMQNQLDESIIGGFILQIDDIQYDASVKNALSTLKEQLEATIVHE
jgi:F-type H+-transporting ATPase subunit delta